MGKERAACWRDKSIRVVSYPKRKDFGRGKGCSDPKRQPGPVFKCCVLGDQPMFV